MMPTSVPVSLSATPPAHSGETRSTSTVTSIALPDGERFTSRNCPASSLMFM
jgi:hypothetical protein